jgi:hypothetical protein
MFLIYACSTLAESLRRSISHRFETQPHLSAVVSAISGLILLAFLWSVLTAFLWSPKRTIYGSVGGIVTSVRGEPVADAVVLFINEAAGFGTSGQTDYAGRYMITRVQPGTYAVAIQPVVHSGSNALTQEDVVAAKSQLESHVPLRFQDASTSGLAAELKRGPNFHDVDLSRNP